LHAERRWLPDADPERPDAAGLAVLLAQIVSVVGWVSVASELRWRRAVRSTRNPPSCSRHYAHQHAAPMVGYAWIRGQSNMDRAGHANPPYELPAQIVSVVGWVGVASELQWRRAV